MAITDWVSAALGPIAGLAGGFLSDKSRESQAQSAEATQREFAQMGIRWRVADAKAAGLHPLYALGGPSATYSPPPITTGVGDSLRQAGQDLSRAIQAQGTAADREARDLQLAAAKSAIHKDEAIASYFNSMAARGTQDANVATAFPVSPVPHLPMADLTRGEALSGGWITERPRKWPDLQGQAPSVPLGPDARIEGAGRAGYPHLADKMKRGWREFVWSSAPGEKPLTILLPEADTMGEALEQVPWYGWGLVMRENTKAYGMRWLWDFYSGQSRPDAPRELRR